MHVEGRPREPYHKTFRYEEEEWVVKVRKLIGHWQRRFGP
jgi:hypothetical protein